MAVRNFFPISFVENSSDQVPGIKNDQPLGSDVPPKLTSVCIITGEWGGDMSKISLFFINVFAEKLKKVPLRFLVEDIALNFMFERTLFGLLMYVNKSKHCHLLGE